MGKDIEVRKQRIPARGLKLTVSFSDKSDASFRQKTTNPRKGIETIAVIVLIFFSLFLSENNESPQGD